ncbi:hypothetical protein GCM10011511_14820 [Puia dinghuensis]|uniref:Uncharacterized protein n=1 Tax=Puia dinghuensis TaxID=1792502 RepID=A0A8J2UB72_9BACT|nr:hypothetical protein GCM10011511_14820 [Puia dinghuensis]
MKYFLKSKYKVVLLRRKFSKLIGAGSGCDDIGTDKDPEEQRIVDYLYYSTIQFRTND